MKTHKESLVTAWVEEVGSNYTDLEAAVVTISDPHPSITFF